MIRVIIEYPHRPQSLEPGRINAREIWRVAEATRRVVCRHPNRTAVDVSEIMARSKHLRVNGLDFETHWDCSSPVTDEEGAEVLGATHYDPETGGAFIAINPDLIGDRNELWRSTAAHELGHAIFDAPGWICAGSNASAPNAMLRASEIQQATSEGNIAGHVMDWREWRATEFMGGFLAPKGLLRRQFLKAAVALGLPLQSDGQSAPMVDAYSSGHHRIDAAAAECAQVFGLSQSFISVRLRKYQLVCGE